MKINIRITTVRLVQVAEEYAHEAQIIDHMANILEEHHQDPRLLDEKSEQLRGRAADIRRYIGQQ